MIAADTKILRIGEVMARRPQIAASATLREAAEQLRRGHVDGLVVLHDDGAVAGVFTERDLVFAAQAEHEGFSGLVGDYVNKGYLRAWEDEDAVEVVDRMRALHLRRAVVFDREQNPTGIIAPELVSTMSSGRADFVLEVGGERFGASAAMPGDSTREPGPGAPSAQLTVGVSAIGARRLAQLAGHEARLLTNAALDDTGASREVARLKLVKVDVDTALVIAEPR
ncbi:MAG: CBS domain-containing protein [Myxococcaceae bacterium]|nr:CBS domain-containing protein [Myxococcaceae bacterium]